MHNLVHLCIEITCTFLSTLIIIPLLLTFVLNKERFRLCLGTGFFAAGIANLLHALISHKIGIVPESGPEFFIPLSGLLPRFTLPLFFFAGIICQKYYPESRFPTKEIFVFAPLSLIMIIFIAGLISRGEEKIGLIFPSDLISRPQDIMAGIIGLFVSIFYINNKLPLMRNLSIGLILLSISSILLSFSGGIGSVMYITAHGVKLISFLSFSVIIILDTWRIRNIERERYYLYEELTQQKKFVENVLRSIGEGVYTTDREKNIITWSKGAEKITGFSALEVIGRKCSEFLKHRDEGGNILCDTPNCPKTQVIERGSIAGPITAILITKMGIERKIEITASPVFEEGDEIKNVVEIFRDVTDEKRAQKQLQLAHDKLIQLNEFKNNLTHMIVHDLKNPLAAIMSTAELMRYDKNIPEEEMQENFNIILCESRRILNMVNSLLDVEKFESGKLKLNKTQFDLNEVIRNEINMLNTSAKLKNIRIIFNEDKNLPLACGDQVLIERVITNIIDNAMKYAKSTVNISAFIHKEKPEKIVICVEDDGIGIPPEYHQKIFEKFGMVELRQKGKKYSTGLGLTFCKMAVEAHGGRIWVESNGVKGSKFYFTLPVAGI